MTNFYIPKAIVQKIIHIVNKKLVKLAKIFSLVVAMEFFFPISLAFGIGLACAFLAIYISMKMYAIRKKNPLGRWNSWVTASSIRLLSLLMGYIIITYLTQKFNIDRQTNELMIWIFTAIILVSILAHIKIIRSRSNKETKTKNV